MIECRQTNRRQSWEWYTCSRCGGNFPRPKVLYQNGLLVCKGEGTYNCYDQPGRQAYLGDVDLPTEQPIEPLPEVTEEI